MKNLYKIRTFFIKHGKTAGFTCLSLAIFSMLMVHFTSLDNIFFKMVFVFLFSGILLLISSLVTDCNKNHNFPTQSNELHKGKRLFDPQNSISPFCAFNRSKL